jgi:Flp pilus assembly pilin Flp
MKRGEPLGFCFCKDERGASAIEYGLISCLIALVVVYAAAKGLTPTLVYQWAAVMAKLPGDDDGGATSTFPEN